MISIGVLKGLIQHGVNVPEDFSIVSLTMFIWRVCHTVFNYSQSRHCGKGKRAVQLILDATGNKEKSYTDCVLPLCLVERDSVIEFRCEQC